MAVKDYQIHQLTPALSLTTSGSCDYAGFVAGWVVLLLNTLTDVRKGWSQFYKNVHRVIISPTGIAYPGDAAPGDGGTKVTVDFAGAPATVVMTRVEDVRLSDGWCVITKGDHVIAYSATIIASVTTEPTP